MQLDPDCGNIGAPRPQPPKAKPGVPACPLHWRAGWGDGEVGLGEQQLPGPLALTWPSPAASPPWLPSALRP